MASNALAEKMEKMVGKIIILREIFEAKDTLFGPFSSERTMQMKSKIWTDILEKAKSLGLVAACKDYKYMRDIYWQNMKRHSCQKRENEQKHGKKSTVSPIDDLVYEIVDNTSTLHQQTSLKDHQKSIMPSLFNTSLNHSVMLKTDHINIEVVNEDENDVNEHENDGNEHENDVNGDENCEDVNFTIEEVDHLEEEFSEEPAEVTKPSEDKPSQPNYEITPDAPSSPQNNGPEGTIYGYDRLKQKVEEGKLKKRKVQLEIDFLELQNYKTQLEVLSLERKLGITPSKFTVELAKKRKKTNLVFENDDDEDSDCNSD